MKKKKKKNCFNASFFLMNIKQIFKMNKENAYIYICLDYFNWSIQVTYYLLSISLDKRNTSCLFSFISTIPSIWLERKYSKTKCRCRVRLIITSFIVVLKPFTSKLLSLSHSFFFLYMWRHIYVEQGRLSHKSISVLHTHSCMYKSWV